MNDKKFDVVVLGEAPGALWCLKQLANSGMKLGLITFDSSCRMPIALDENIAQQFAITFTHPWSLELVTPKEHLIWNKENLLSRYPDFQNLKRRDLPGFLVKHPEVLSFCQGIWKRMGRAENLSPLTYVTALFVDKVMWWNPMQEVPDVVSQLHLPNLSFIKSLDFLDRGEFQIRTESETWDTKHLCLALDPFELSAIKETVILRALGHTLSSFSGGLVPVVFKMKKDFIPSVLHPITVLFENTAIPDPQTEILPFDFDGEDLTLWVWSPYPLNEQSVSNATQRALEQLSKHIPMMPLGIIEKGKANRLVPHFDHARLYGFRTRHKSLSWITPDQSCQLMYPAGSLQVGRDLVLHLAGKSKNFKSPLRQAPY